MVWFTVDDLWHSHPKTAGLSLAARGLWVTAGSWCGQHLTDGKVPKKMLRVWAAPEKLARELVASGLWLEHDASHYQFHDWETYNQTREQALARRAADAARKRNSDRTPRGVQTGIRTESTRSPAGIQTESDRIPRSQFRSDPNLRISSLGGVVNKLASKSDEMIDVSPESPPPNKKIERAPHVLSALVLTWRDLTKQELEPWEFEPLLAELLDSAERSGNDPILVFRHAARAFVADCVERERHPVLRWLCNQLGEWIGASQNGASATGERRTMSELTEEQKADLEAFVRRGAAS